jgi:hypothetical protein
MLTRITLLFSEHGITPKSAVLPFTNLYEVVGAWISGELDDWRLFSDLRLYVFGAASGMR